MPNKISKFLIPVVGATVVVGGGIAAYLYFKAPLGGNVSAMDSAKVVPAEALASAYINTDPQAWAKLQQFGTPQAQQLLAQNLENFKKQVFTDNNISYENDIQPWVGGVMIAVLPPNLAKPAQLTTPAPGQTQNILLVVGIKDKLGALNFANKLKADKNSKIQESDYKGETITEIDQGKPTYSAVLNNAEVVLSPERHTVEEAIDTFKGQPSFASKEGASNILAQGAEVQNPLVQVYVPEYGSVVQQLVASNPQAPQLSPQAINQLKLVKFMVAGVGVDEAGLRFKASANLDPNLNQIPYQQTSSKIIGQLPSDTFALINGQGISRIWQTFLEQSKDYPQIQQQLQQVRERLQTANFDLDKDIFGWMDGEFAISAIQSNQGVLAPVGFGGALLFNTSDRQTAEATLSKLDDLAKKQSVNVAQRNIEGKDITEWQIPQQGALLAHGWLDQNTLFVAIGGPIADSVVEHKSPTLDASDTFKAATDSLQKPNGGYFYLDMDKALTLLNHISPLATSYPPGTSDILNSIRGVGITALSPDKSTSKLEMLVALKPNTAK
jgi:hypothetical protein